MPTGSSPSLGGGSKSRPSPIPSGSRANTATTVDSDIGDEMSDYGNQTVISFDTKLRRSKKFIQTLGWHEVTISLNFALAVASPTEDITVQNPTVHRMSTVDSPKPQNFYHLEFKLSPEDAEPMKTDVVFYGSAARVYPERNDAKSVKTWSYNNETWVGWTQNIRVKVNNDLLVALSNYQMTVRIWDTKDKCGSKARFDRPKGFRFPAPHPDQDPDSVGGVKQHVLKLARQIEKSPTGKTNFERPLPMQKPIKASAPASQIIKASKSASVAPTEVAAPPTTVEKPVENYAVYTVSRPDQQQGNQPFTRLLDLAAPFGAEPKDPIEPQRGYSGKRTPAKTPLPRAPSAKKGKPENTLSNAFEGFDASPEPVQTETHRGSKQKRVKKEDPEQEYYDKNGRTTMTVNMAHLFTRKSIFERLSEPAMALEDVLLSVYINEPLLSDVQKYELNPFVVRIKSAKDMPSTPKNYETLQNECEQVYCKYQFFNLEPHITAGKTHKSEIIWDDVQVILTGLLDKEALREYMLGIPMEIEVHDRDRKPPVDAFTPALFGADLEDEKICNISMVTTKRTAHSAFNKSPNKVWDPYGLVHVSFDELLRGTKLISVNIPITPCSVPGVLGLEQDHNGRLIGIAGAVDGPNDPPAQVGNYLNSGAVLNVTLELLYPLTEIVNNKEDNPVKTKTSCPFGRIIYILDDSKETMLASIKNVVRKINASVLGLENSPEHVITTALHTFKMNENKKNDGEFNIITGFHVTDGKFHILVLEGPKLGSIRSLWMSLGRYSTQRENINILYNNDYSFSKRLYGELDADIAPIRTHEPLSEIVKQPLLYVRDIVPKACFQGIMKLHSLSNCQNLQTAVTNSFIPTSEMVAAVSREFGVPLSIAGSSSKEDYNQSSKTGDSKDRNSKQPKYVAVSRWMGKLDNFNESYYHALHARQDNESRINFVKENILEVRKSSKKIRAQSCPVPKVVAPNAEGHNYSIQTLNSTMQSRQELKSRLDSNKRYTYSHQFLRSATIEPIDPVEAKKKEEADSKSKWRKPQGWVFPSVPNSIDSNIHPKLPDPATREALQTPWVENQLHAGALEPTVPGRENYSFETYNQDFDRFSLPRGYFGAEPPSIMPSGDTKDNEMTEISMKESQQWLRKVVVNDTAFHTHRVLPASEMKTTGLPAANQLDRLIGLRKDPPLKYGLVSPGYRDLPALRVLEIDLEPPGTGYTVDSSEKNDMRRHYIPTNEKNRGLNPIYRPREPISLRRIHALKPEERQKHHMFQTLPPSAQKIY